MFTRQEAERYGWLREGAKKEQKTFDEAIFNKTRQVVNNRTLEIAQMNNRGSNFGIADESGFINVYPTVGDALKELNKDIEKDEIIKTLDPDVSYFSKKAQDNDDEFYSSRWFQADETLTASKINKPSFDKAFRLNPDRQITMRPPNKPELPGIIFKGDNGFMSLFKVPGKKAYEPDSSRYETV